MFSPIDGPLDGLYYIYGRLITQACVFRYMRHSSMQSLGETIKHGH